MALLTITAKMQLTENKCFRTQRTTRGCLWRRTFWLKSTGVIQWEVAIRQLFFLGCAQTEMIRSLKHLSEILPVPPR